MLSKATKQDIEGSVALAKNRKKIILPGRQPYESLKDTQILFHIEAKDLFATIATVLRLTRERLKERYGGDVIFENEIIEEVENELLYLQRKYTIKDRLDC